MSPKDYFYAYKGYFWQWEEDGEVLSITGGSTIAYTNQLITQLSAIAEGGLPSFGAILLANIAINSGDNDDLMFIRQNIFNDQLPITLEATQLLDCFNFLETLRAVPEKFKTGQMRPMLLQTIFSNAHNRISIKTSKGLVEYLKERKLKQRDEVVPPQFRRAVQQDIKILSILNKQFQSPASIIEAMIDVPMIEEALIPSLETTTTSAVTYTDFVEELIDNPLTFHVGSLIKAIWAGFKVPIFNAHPSEQPLGGITDLSNKGNFDRLLASEFANDDLILLSRLANNEALYLHREMPPVADKLQRTILIDISLKNWGIPKTLAHAVSLAIAKHPKAKSESLIFTVGDYYSSNTYKNLLDTLKAIQEVDISLTASKGIIALLNDNKSSPLELFLITTNEAFKNASIQQILAENRHVFKYIIIVDRTGEINFYRYKNSGLTLLQNIKLPLEKLWANPTRKSTPKILNEQTQPLYPILFPTPFKKIKVIPFGNNEHYIISKRDLLRQLKQPTEIITSKGCEIILKNIPISGKYELGQTNSGELLFAAYNFEDKKITITNLHSLDAATTSFSDWKPSVIEGFLFYNNRFHLLINRSAYYTLKPDFEAKTIEISQHNGIRDEYNEAYKLRQDEINKGQIKQAQINYIKRPATIYITEQGELALNSHKICNPYNDSFIFSSFPKTEATKKAIATYDRTRKIFVFKDGSHVTVDPNGALILTSSNTDIPDIFISTVMEQNLGMATQHHFSGNDSFFRIPYLMVELHSISSKKINAVRIINAYTACGLKQAKQLVDSIPNKFSLYLNLDRANNMQKDLLEIGCQMSFTSNMSQEQTILSPKEFYTTYISRFINHILQYES